jgi:hypothetical protein
MNYHNTLSQTMLAATQIQLQEILFQIKQKQVAFFHP